MPVFSKSRHCSSPIRGRLGCVTLDGSVSAALAGCGPVTRSMLAFALVLASAPCGSNPRYAARWVGRRGYDGNGDYGSDLAASRSEARLYRQPVAATYPRPGPAQDPWGPYIAEAGRRFRVPERWIREVMRQESGGRERDADGAPITS